MSGSHLWACCCEKQQVVAPSWGEVEFNTRVQGVFLLQCLSLTWVRTDTRRIRALQVACYVSPDLCILHALAAARVNKQRTAVGVALPGIGK